jgi:hypothetical protein
MQLHDHETSRDLVCLYLVHMAMAMPVAPKGKVSVKRSDSMLLLKTVSSVPWLITSAASLRRHSRMI